MRAQEERKGVREEEKEEEGERERDGSQFSERNLPTKKSSR